MKTQRRRDRVRPLQPSDASSTHNGSDSATDGDLSHNGHDGAIADGAANGSAGDGSVTEMNGHSGGDGNGHSSPPSPSSPSSPRQSSSAPTLPKRRQRVAVPPQSTTTIAPAGQVGAAVERATATAQSTEREAYVPATEAGARGWRLLVTYENLIWMTIFLVAIISRFWDVGNRGIHHDESLHAQFSRQLYTGGGYTHDPMMHGPLQFHLIAAMYWLFGMTEATARFASVFCGIFVVMSPFFLRRQLGKITALVCAFLLLVSPSILYFSRMAREDAIFSAMEMIMIVGLWRFISMRKPGDFYVFCAGLALMFTIKETAFLTVAVLGVFFALLFAYQAGYAILGALGAYLGGLGALVVFVNSGMKAGTIAELPDIPATNPGYEIILDFVGKLLTHPLVLGATLLTLLFIGALVTLFIAKRAAMRNAAYVPAEAVGADLPRRRIVRAQVEGETVPLASGSDINGHEPHNGHDVLPASDGSTTPIEAEAASEAPLRGWQEPDASPAWDPKRLDPKPGTLLAHYEAGSLPHLLGALFARPRVLLIGFTIAAAIFTVLYTVFFTDMPRGIASGLFASLGYWMAQHDVRRGDQPWFFYFLLIPLYEPIAVLFSLVAATFFSFRGVKWLVGRFRGAGQAGERVAQHLGWFNTDREVPFASFHAFLVVFVAWWLLGATFIYSWAGEKMPWLMVHMVRPAIFFAALVIGALIASLLARRRARIAQFEAEAVAFAPAIEEQQPIVGRRRGVGGSTSTLAPAVPAIAATPVLSAQQPPWEVWLGPNSLLPFLGFVFLALFGTLAAVLKQPVLATLVFTTLFIGLIGWFLYQRYLGVQPGAERPRSLVPSLSYLTMFGLLALGWGLTMNSMVFDNNYAEWGLTWLFPLAMLGLTGVYMAWIGPRRALQYMALGVLAIGLLYEFRSATILAYQQPDVSKELASYVQTSPDVTRVMREIDAYSLTTLGNKDVKIMYDGFASWPFVWYLRDYKNAQLIGEDVEANPDVATTPILILEYGFHNSNQKLLENYIPQRYAMRWWFPQEWYMNRFLPGQDYRTAPFLNQLGGAVSTTVGTFTSPQNQGILWKYLIFREPPDPLGSEDLILYLRKDIAQQFHYIQYKPPPSTDVPVTKQGQPSPGQVLNVP